MFFVNRRMGAIMIAGVIASGLLTGCVNINPGPSVPTVDVNVPTLPPIPIDTTKSFEAQVEELKTGFAKVYCPVRNSPIADALADEGKRLWNEIAARAQQQGAPIPGFDPDDPEMCQ
jgi:hypothetical protein